MMYPSEFLRNLDSKLPKFAVSSSAITILGTPTEFYENLINKIQTETSRIFLSSLYLSSDAIEVREALRKSLRCHPKLKVFILVDKLRSSRQDPGSDPASPTPLCALRSLVREWGPSRVEIRLYHTPNLTGIWRHLIPAPLNEGFGLQHIKVYGFTDEVIISGANLGQEYFTDRQDRYFIFRSAELTDYFHEFLQALGGFCYQILPSDATCASRHGNRVKDLEWPKTNHLSKPLEYCCLQDIHQSAIKTLRPLLWKGNHIRSPEPSDSGEKAKIFKDELQSECSMASQPDTIIYPLAQLAPLFGRKLDTISPDEMEQNSSHEWVLARLLSLLPYCASWTLATPYPNLPWPIQHAVTETSPHHSFLKRASSHQGWGTFIVAAPKAMSFYNAKGLLGFVPGAFLREVEQIMQLLKRSKSVDAAEEVQVRSWQRGVAHQKNGWTFHAKGWWLWDIQMQDEGCKSNELNNSHDVVFTMIGSSNYGQRSLTLDLEMDIVIKTTNESLKTRLRTEENNILRHSRQFCTTEFKAKGWVSAGVITVVLWIIRVLGLSI